MGEGLSLADGAAKSTFRCRRSVSVFLARLAESVVHPEVMIRTIVSSKTIVRVILSTPVFVFLVMVMFFIAASQQNLRFSCGIIYTGYCVLSSGL